MSTIKTPTLRFQNFENASWNKNALIGLLNRIIDYRGQSVPKAETGIPLITARNVRDGYIDFTHQEYVCESRYEDWSTRGTPSKGDILFTTEAPLGKVCRFPTNGTYAVGQRTVTLRTNEKLCSDFLLHFLLSSYGQRLIDLRSSGTTAKGIKSSELKKVAITYSENLAEQQKIADFLTSVDTKISQLTEKHRLLKEYKKGVMQQIFSQKISFKDKDGKAFPEWEVKRLIDIADPIKRKTDNIIDNVMTVSAGKGFLHQKDRFSQVIAGTSLDKYTHLKKGEFSYNRGNSKSFKYGCIYPLIADEALVPFVYRSFKLKSGVSDFYAQLFANKYLDRQLRRLISSSARMDGLLNIGEKDFYQVTLPVPSEDEQQKIAKFLQSIDRKIEAVAEQVEQTKQFKKGLLQQMFV